MNRRNFSQILLVAPAFAAGSLPPSRAEFEPQPRVLVKGRSPKFVTRRAHGLSVIYTVAAPGGGMDLMFQSSPDLGDTFTEPVRVNDVPGEVSDHGENSAQLFYSDSTDALYAVWNARVKDAPGTIIRFASSSAMRPAWSKALTINDDGAQASHGFQGAAVGPDGTIYAAWLDVRGRSQSETYTGSGSSVYIATSRDSGKTFSKNIQVARDVCPCCRPSFGFAKGQVVVAWRGIEAGDMRDIWAASSSDSGATWNKQHLAVRDGWKIKGCPHVGPSIAALNGILYMAWFSEAGGKPAILMADSADGGKTWLHRAAVSTGTTDPTHPQLAEGDGRIGLVFQARAAGKAAGWGKVGAYYREIAGPGAITPLQRVGEGAVTSNYPSVALGLSGRIFIGWSETTDGGANAYLIRGRRA